MSAPANPSIVALVPMRHESERVPGKNFRHMAGRPLYAYILETLSQIEALSAIVVNTDSEVIRSGVAADFPNVRLLERPEHLRRGEIPMNEVLLFDTEQVQADFYLQTHSTNPLLKPQTIQRAIEAFLEAYPAKDSLFSVTELHTRLYDAQGAAINHDPGHLLRTQDLPPVYEENSCLYLFTRQTLEQNGHRIGAKPLMFPIPAQEALDIDEESDFRLAEVLLKLRNAA